jgi:cell wall-associated NlpC family hydrolase
MRTRIITKAVLPFLNKPYSLGCNNDGFDCLGLLWSVFDKLGIALPREYKEFNYSNYASKWESGEGREELISYLDSLGHEVLFSYIIPGDIVLYKSGFGIYVGSGKMVTAIEEHGVLIIPIKGLAEKAIRVVV